MNPSIVCSDLILSLPPLLTICRMSFTFSGATLTAIMILWHKSQHSGGRGGSVNPSLILYAAFNYVENSRPFWAGLYHKPPKTNLKICVLSPPCSPPPQRLSSPNLNSMYGCRCRSGCGHVWKPRVHTKCLSSTSTRHHVISVKTNFVSGCQYPWQPQDGPQELQAFVSHLMWEF